MFSTLRHFGVNGGIDSVGEDHFYTYLLLFLAFACMQAVNVLVVGTTLNTLSFSA